MAETRAGDSLVFHANRKVADPAEKQETSRAVAVTLFGFFLVVGVRTKTSETFLANATYAAILIVFVGSSSQTCD